MRFVRGGLGLVLAFGLFTGPANAQPQSNMTELTGVALLKACKAELMWTANSRRLYSPPYGLARRRKQPLGRPYEP
jgi:hypothetical protein